MNKTICQTTITSNTSNFYLIGEWLGTVASESPNYAATVNNSSMLRGKLSLRKMLNKYTKEKPLSQQQIVWPDHCATLLLSHSAHVADVPLHVASGAIRAAAASYKDINSSQRPLCIFLWDEEIIVHDLSDSALANRSSPQSRLPKVPSSKDCLTSRWRFASLIC